MRQDIRYAIRLLGRSPGFAAAAILTLMLGIGMTSAIFSVVDAVLLRPVSIPDADRIVMVWETDRDTGTSHEPGAWPDFIDFEQRSRRIDTFAGVIAGETTMTPDTGEPARLASMYVTRNFLPLMGVAPIVGRSFTREDESLAAPPIVLISERLWDRLFTRDPHVVGRTLRLDDRIRTIAGVVRDGADFGVLQVLAAADYSRGFVDRDARSIVDIWAPLQPNPQRLVRDTHPLIMMGRLAAGASLDSAQEELAAIAADLERAYPSNKARGVHLEPLQRVIFGRTRPALLVLLAAVGVVLVIACVNVANLLLARGTTRQREVAVRSAIGADTRQLARQFVVENLLLTIIASVLGIALALLVTRTLVALAPPEVPRILTVAVNGRVLSLALGISTVVGFAFGFVPLIQSRRTDLQAALNADDTRGVAGGRRSHLTRSALVVAEIALAVVLVIGAGLLIKSFWRLQQVNPGFDPSGVLKAEFQLPARYATVADRWPNLPAVHRFNGALLTRAAALPGVEQVALASSHPLNPGFTNSFVIVGREDESRDLPEITMRHVTPGYFQTLRVPLVKGRFLRDSDATDAPAVVVINEAAARRLFADRDPLGQQIAFWDVRWTIVGVAGDEKFHGLTEASPIAAYLSLAQAPSRSGETLLVRTAGNPGILATTVRAAITEIDPSLAVFGLEPLSRTLAESIGTARFLMLLLLLFAALALVLAAVGIHGVLSYTVAERTREIGIRVALGASPRAVTRLVWGQGARLTLFGLAAGLLLGVGFARLLAGLLFGVAATDAATFAAVLAVLGVVGGLSAWLPVRRAVRLDPLVSLRRA
jgi:predicted permease